MWLLFCLALPGSWPWPEIDGAEGGPLFPSLHLLAEYFGHSFSPRATLSSRLTLPTDRPEPEAIDFAKEDKRLWRQSSFRMH